MLVEMGILSGDEYQSNVSAFASFDLRPKLAAAPSSADRPLPIRCQSIAPDSLAASPVDSSCTKVGSITTDASPQLYTPRSAGKIASRADVGQGVSGDSFRTEVASPESAMPARLSDSLSLLSAIVWSPMSNGTGGQSLLESTENIKSPQAHLTPQHLSPVSHHAPNIANGNHSAHGAQLEPGTAAESSDTRGSGSLTGHERSLSCGKLPDPQRPFSHPIDSHELLRPISVVSSFDISGDISVDEGKRHRFLSPTEQANASLFSMLDAAQTESSSSIGGEFAPPRNQVEPPSPARLVSAATDNGRLDKGRDAALAKPARIRRRALTAFAGDISDYSRGNAHAVNRSSTHSAQERPGGSRLSKLLSGIGLGAPKPKPPQKPSFILHDYYRVDANAAGQGKMTSTADVNRDRSNSDSTEARMARVRKVHSTIDGASAGISRFGRPYSAAAEK
ncbi:hypothetical protein GGI04_005615 [Coemansia thaxteri]|nr:hypothetical protein GGI04_005615 [Coemansia thaxteri]